MYVGNPNCYLTLRISASRAGIHRHVVSRGWACRLVLGPTHCGQCNRNRQDELGFHARRIITSQDSKRNTLALNKLAIAQIDILK
jgi:hypothetical protein